MRSKTKRSQHSQECKDPRRRCFFPAGCEGIHVDCRHRGVRAFLVTHAGCIAAGVGIAFRRVCLSVCLSVCPRSKRKTAWAINTNLCTRILYSSRSVCIDPEVKRSKVKGQGHTVTKTVTAARLLVTRAATVVCCCCWRGSACRYDCLFSSSLYFQYGKQ